MADLHPLMAFQNHIPPLNPATVLQSSSRHALADVPLVHHERYTEEVLRARELSLGRHADALSQKSLEDARILAAHRSAASQFAKEELLRPEPYDQRRHESYFHASREYMRLMGDDRRDPYREKQRLSEDLEKQKRLLIEDLARDQTIRQNLHRPSQPGLVYADEVRLVAPYPPPPSQAHVLALQGIYPRGPVLPSQVPPKFAPNMQPLRPAMPVNQASYHHARPRMAAYEDGAPYHTQSHNVRKPPTSGGAEGYIKEFEVRVTKVNVPSMPKEKGQQSFMSKHSESPASPTRLSSKEDPRSFMPTRFRSPNEKREEDRVESLRFGASTVRPNVELKHTGVKRSPDNSSENVRRTIDNKTTSKISRSPSPSDDLVIDVTSDDGKVDDGHAQDASGASHTSLASGSHCLHSDYVGMVGEGKNSYNDLSEVNCCEHECVDSGSTDSQDVVQADGSSGTKGDCSKVGDAQICPPVRDARHNDEEVAQKQSSEHGSDIEVADSPNGGSLHKKKRGKQLGKRSDDREDVVASQHRLALDLPRHNWLVERLVQEKKLPADSQAKDTPLTEFARKLDEHLLQSDDASQSLDQAKPEQKILEVKSDAGRKNGTSLPDFESSADRGASEERLRSADSLVTGNSKAAANSMTASVEPDMREHQTGVSDIKDQETSRRARSTSSFASASTPIDAAACYGKEKLSPKAAEQVEPTTAKPFLSPSPPRASASNLPRMQVLPSLVPTSTISPPDLISAAPRLCSPVPCLTRGRDFTEGDRAEAATSRVPSNSVQSEPRGLSNSVDKFQSDVDTKKQSSMVGATLENKRPSASVESLSPVPLSRYPSHASLKLSPNPNSYQQQLMERRCDLPVHPTARLLEKEGSTFPAPVGSALRMEQGRRLSDMDAVARLEHARRGMPMDVAAFSEYDAKSRLLAAEKDAQLRYEYDRRYMECLSQAAERMQPALHRQDSLPRSHSQTEQMLRSESILHPDLMHHRKYDPAITSPMQRPPDVAYLSKIREPDALPAYRNQVHPLVSPNVIRPGDYIDPRTHPLSRPHPLTRPLNSAPPGYIRDSVFNDQKKMTTLDSLDNDSYLSRARADVDLRDPRDPRDPRVLSPRHMAERSGMVTVDGRLHPPRPHVYPSHSALALERHALKEREMQIMEAVRKQEQALLLAGSSDPSLAHLAADRRSSLPSGHALGKYSSPVHEPTQPMPYSVHPDSISSLNERVRTVEDLRALQMRASSPTAKLFDSRRSPAFRLQLSESEHLALKEAELRAQLPARVEHNPGNRLIHDAFLERTRHGGTQNGKTFLSGSSLQPPDPIRRSSLDRNPSIEEIHMQSMAAHGRHQGHEFFPEAHPAYRDSERGSSKEPSSPRSDQSAQLFFSHKIPRTRDGSLDFGRSKPVDYSFLETQNPGLTHERPIGVAERMTGLGERAQGMVERTAGVAERTPGMAERTPGMAERTPVATDRALEAPSSLVSLKRTSSVPLSTATDPQPSKVSRLASAQSSRYISAELYKRLSQDETNKQPPPKPTVTDLAACKSKAESSEKRFCKICSKEAQFLCSGCRNSWYCSQQCQLTEWRTHSKTCNKAGAGSLKETSPAS